MRFLVLGPVEAYANGRRVAIGAGRRLAVLAMLLIHAGEVVPRDRLIHDLWPGRTPSSNRRSLDAAVSRLRRSIRDAGAHDLLSTQDLLGTHDPLGTQDLDNQDLGLILRADDTDAAQFFTMAERGRAALARGDHASAARELAAALALWRGHAYQEFAREPWARAEAERLHALRAVVARDLIEAELALGRRSALGSEPEPDVARKLGRAPIAVGASWLGRSSARRWPLPVTATLAVVAVTAAVLALLGSAPPAPLLNAHRGGTLRVALAAFDVLDPASAGAVHPAIWRATGDGLVALAGSPAGARLVPDLATTVPVPTDGGLSYAFVLRQGLRYSNGTPVRASDLRRELERLFAIGSQDATSYTALRGALGCLRQPRACDLSRGVITDDQTRTITLRLTHPDPDLLFKLTLPAAWPVPPGTSRTRLSSRPVPGTGPYRVGLFAPGHRLLLVRNPWFHQWSRAAQPDGYPDRIDVEMDNDPARRIQAVRAGSADLALEIAADDLGGMSIRYASRLRLDPKPDTSFLIFNSRRGPFRSVLARRAVNLALNRAAVARKLGGPALSVPTCQILPPNSPGYQDYCPYTRPPLNGRWHRPDLARARALVRASGTTGAIVYFISPHADPVAAAANEALVAALRALGYRTRVISNTMQFYRRLADPFGRWDISVGNLAADYPSPGEFLDRFLSCASYHPENPALTTNGGGFCDPRFDRLVARAEATQVTDLGEAQMLWAAADRVAVDEAAWVPLVNTPSANLLSARAGHYTLDAVGLPQIDQLWVRQDSSASK